MCYRKVRHPAVYGGGAPCTAVPRDDQGPAGHGGGEDLSGAGKSEARWSSYLSHARTVLKYASAPFLGRKNRNYDPRPRILLWSKETPPKFAVRRAQSRANIGFTSLGYLYASDFRSRPPARSETLSGNARAGVGAEREGKAIVDFNRLNKLEEVIDELKRAIQSLR